MHLKCQPLDMERLIVEIPRPDSHGYQKNEKITEGEKQAFVNIEDYDSIIYPFQVKKHVLFHDHKFLTLQPPPPFNSKSKDSTTVI